MNRRKLLLSILVLAVLGGLSAWSFNASAATGKKAGSKTTSSSATTTAKQSHKSKQSKNPSVTTTASGPTTTVARTPQAYADALYADWMQRDRPSAAKIATAAVVQTVFSRPWRAASKWVAAGCQSTAGSTSCSWTHPHRKLVLQVRNATAGLPLLVVGVQTLHT